MAGPLRGLAVILLVGSFFGSVSADFFVAEDFVDLVDRRGFSGWVAGFTLLFGVRMLSFSIFGTSYKHS